MLDTMYRYDIYAIKLDMMYRYDVYGKCKLLQRCLVRAQIGQYFWGEVIQKGKATEAQDS